MSQILCVSVQFSREDGSGFGPWKTVPTVPVPLLVSALSFFSLVLLENQGKTSKTARIFLTFRTLRILVKEAENTQKDQGNPEQEKNQGNKKTKEKKDRVGFRKTVLTVPVRFLGHPVLFCSWPMRSQHYDL